MRLDTSSSWTPSITTVSDVSAMTAVSTDSVSFSTVASASAVTDAVVVDDFFPDLSALAFSTTGSRIGKTKRRVEH
jgi:hypothetical protein